MKTIRLVLAFGLLASFVSAQALKADVVLINGKIRPMDTANSTFAAVAIKGNSIAAVGKNADILLLADSSTKIIDLKGKTVIPGFNDAHVHFSETGAQLSSVDLRDARTPQEFVERIRVFASKLPKGRWILGGQWDHENWTPSNLPTAALIDAATPDHPVFINRLDGHMSLANSLAMRLAGIDKNVKEVAGGEIVRDVGGDPTGIFKDAAMVYIEKVIPALSFEQQIEAAQAATDHAASLGVTSVQDMSAGTNIGAYQELLRRGTLKTRVYGCSPMDDYKRWENTGVRSAFGDAMLRVGCLKSYADGSLGSTTAWFFDPYLDAPNSRGLAMADVETTMRQKIRDADKAGLQIRIHAIGDRANAAILDHFKAVDSTNGAADRRFTIEHAQHVRLDDLKRFAGQKVVASMQPFHIIDDGRWAWKRLDEKSLKGTYAFRTILDSGGVLAFGSDSPVAPLNPLWGVYGAVTRRTLDDKNPGGWIPEQKISVVETVRAFTFGSAFAEFQEKVKGTLEVGKLADIVVLSDDIFSIDPVKIRDVKVIMTFVDGRLVYEAK